VGLTILISKEDTNTGSAIWEIKWTAVMNLAVH
jgi:hypothetical protein